MNTKKNKAIVLLSGGLDSYIALSIALSNCEIVLALNFNYGQKAFKQENAAAKKMASIYNIKLQTIQLPYLKELCNNALTEDCNNNLDKFEHVWVPNRNGLFINIAACYCEKYNADKIVIGLNKEEAQSFSDNSVEFIKSADNMLYYSTQNHPKILAPCKDMTKVDIVNYAIDNNLDLNIIKSCYDSCKDSLSYHCGRCLSCKLLYNAIIKSKKPELVKELFNEYIV